MPTPLNAIGYTLVSSSQHIPTLVILSQHIPTLIRDSRRGKGVIDNLTTKVKGMALYKVIASER